MQPGDSAAESEDEYINIIIKPLTPQWEQAENGCKDKTEDDIATMEGYRDALLVCSFMGHSV